MVLIPPLRGTCPLVKDILKAYSFLSRKKSPELGTVSLIILVPVSRNAQ